jgi:alanine racemase
MEKRAWIEVNVNKIRGNIEKIKGHTKRRFMACVKGDCYGMGINRISAGIEKTVDCFGVATASEAITLRDAGIRKPIMILGPVLPGDVETLVMNDITITLFNNELLSALSEVIRKRNKKAVVHIKVDTGLGRIGVRPAETQEFIEKVSKNKGIEIEGIFTHFATAESKDKTYAKKQLSSFNEVIKNLADFNIPIKHIANSPAMLNLPDSYKNFDMIRIGLLLFGVYPKEHLRRKLVLEPAVKGFCRIIYTKTVPKGTHISYGITYTTTETAKIATTGIGYADGLERMLSNNFHFRYKGKRIKVVGNICMDQTLVDVTGKNVKTGDALQVFGDNFEIEEMARICKTIPQEILCGFGSPRMEKVYIK